MKKFIAVIGDPKSGKSTVIRSLTGCPNSIFRDKIIDNNTFQNIFVICSSPQEHDLELKKFRKILDSGTLRGFRVVG